jgi:hypothetical protein
LFADAAEFGEVVDELFFVEDEIGWFRSAERVS